MAKQGRSGGVWSKILSVILFIAIVCVAFFLVIKLTDEVKRHNDSKEAITGASYSIGAVNDEGEVTSGATSIYLRKAVTVDGLTVELEPGYTISYRLYFYDAENKFVSATKALTESFNAEEIPEGAATVRVVITPLADADGKVTSGEINGYAEQVNVSVKI